MNTFYSILKIAPNPSSGDSLSIGLLVRDKEKFWLRFSDKKKKIAKTLLNENAEIVDFIIKQINQKITAVNKELNKSPDSLFGISDLLNLEYFNYLGNYSNGLLQFNPPINIDDEINTATFSKLFSILIDREEVNQQKDNYIIEQEFNKRIEKKLIKKVENNLSQGLTKD